MSKVQNNNGTGSKENTVLDLTKVKEGDKISTWIMMKKLGEGGFGAVYKVKDDSGTFALKTEKANEVVRALKMEVVVLKAAKKKGCQHFCDIIDTGNVGSYNYIVMTLVGTSLHDLRKQVPDPKKQKFSLGCAVSTSIKCMAGIRELHEIGYLHRDIKPGNFAIGMEDPRKILVLDFGMCRRYLDADNGVRKPRWAAGFRGTLRYASISSHISREMCRKDDLESWLYQTIELTKGQLPWKSLEKAEDVCRNKEKCRNDAIQDLFGGCPKEYVRILRYIDSLRYYDTPDYDRIVTWMKDILTNNNVKQYPYDWEKESPMYVNHNTSTDKEEAAIDL